MGLLDADVVLAGDAGAAVGVHKHAQLTARVQAVRQSGGDVGEVHGLHCCCVCCASQL